jgi:hypothetical protein
LTDCLQAPAVPNDVDRAGAGGERGSRYEHGNIGVVTMLRIKIVQFVILFLVVYVTVYWLLKIRRGFSSEEYLATVKDHLKELKFRTGVLLSAELGERNESLHYMLLQSHDKKPRILSSQLCTMCR